VFLDRLQSGFLLLATRQGRVRVEVSLRERIYLLWTFRNFRHLSIPLLNARQRALVNSLSDRGVPCERYDPGLVIGVVDNYRPPPPAAASPQEEAVTTRPAVVAAKPAPVLLPSPKAARPAAATRSAAAKLATVKLATPRLAAAVGALSLCLISVVGWHRIQGIPVSQAHDRAGLPQINASVATEVPQSAELATSVEPKVFEKAISTEAPVKAMPGVPTEAGPEAAVKPATNAAMVRVVRPAPVAVPITAPKAAPRVHNTTPPAPISKPTTAIPATRPPLHFVYPDGGEAHARGVVSLTATLDSEGAVRAVRVVSGNRALAGAAVRAVRRWRYRPYVKDGQPVATETNIVISFLSEDAISMSYPPSLSANR
jgi:periplasmic protein TonB